MRLFRRSSAIKGILGAALLALAIYGLANLSDVLVLDNREKSDILVITQADSLDDSYALGLELLSQGYGHKLLLDARTDKIFFGRSQAEWASDFIAKTTAGTSYAGKVAVCAMTADTTAEEVYDVAKCLEGRSARSVMLVVHDYHCHRSLTIFSRLLPQYRWSVAAVPGKRDFDRHWWRKRAWIRTTMVECQHFLWWFAIDRWRFMPIAAAK